MALCRVLLLIVILVSGCFADGSDESPSIDVDGEQRGDSKCVGECDRRSRMVDALQVVLENAVQIQMTQGKGMHEIRNSLFQPRDCSDLRASGLHKSGIHQIALGVDGGQRQVQVYCDFDTADVGWLVFQRRQDGSRNFERTWNAYANGFGDLSGEFWLGNDVLNLLTSQRKYKLRIDLEDFSGEKRYAEYSQFDVGPEADFYKLTVGGYSGNAGDSMSYHNGMKFSTIDVENDLWDQNCAQVFHGAWWYNACHLANLNGLYLRGNHKSFADGIEWKTWHGYNYSLKITEMKITPLV